MKTALTIAGSDSSGGAGIQADLKTFAAHKVYGMSVITALTAQNTSGVYAIADTSAAMVSAQMEAVFCDIFPDAVKIGMVSSGDIAGAIADGLEKYKPSNIVIDPVMVSTSNAALMADGVHKIMADRLFPLADIITPNIPEAETLAEMKIGGVDDMLEAARRICEITPAAILIKGGHLDDTCDDLLYQNGEYVWFSSERIDNPNTHGTGCTLSSAIAANLANGSDMIAAVSAAKDYVLGAIKYGLKLGKGEHGPLNHAYSNGCK